MDLSRAKPTGTLLIWFMAMNDRFSFIFAGSFVTFGKILRSV